MADADRWFATQREHYITPSRILRTRVYTVEAKQVLVGLESEVAEWCGGHAQYGYGVIVVTDTGQPVIAAYGDWIVRGARRTYRIVSDRDIFAEYEAVIPVVSE